MRAKLLALVAGGTLALTTAAPASATSWDGNYFDFGLGQTWRLSSFSINDVDLSTQVLEFTQPASDGIYTDIWDTGLEITLDSVGAGIAGYTYDCDNSSDVDITSGDDLVIDCTTDWSTPTNTDVDIRGNIRIYGPNGDLVRYMLKITNNSNTDITDFTVDTLTNFGSSGDIWGYQNYDATALTVPASEASENAAALESTGSDWLVNFDGSDPSGSLAWGNAGGSVDVQLTETDGDDISTSSEEFTVAAGETVYLIYFTGWNPTHLNDVGYSDANRFGTVADAEANADAVVASAAEFDTFSGRLTSGLPDGANVINWGPIVVDDNEEALADTGADTSSLWAGLGLLVAGVGVVAVRRRVRA